MSNQAFFGYRASFLDKIFGPFPPANIDFSISTHGLNSNTEKVKESKIVNRQKAWGGGGSGLPGYGGFRQEGGGERLPDEHKLNWPTSDPTSYRPLMLGAINPKSLISALGSSTYPKSPMPSVL